MCIYVCAHMCVCIACGTQETGKAIYLGGRKGRRENVFRALLAAGVWLLRGQTTKPARCHDLSFLNVEL